MRKIAIIFPDINYQNTNPLMYYGTKVMQQQGYEAITVNYDEINTDALQQNLRNHKKISERILHDSLVNFLMEALRSVEKQLSITELRAYDKLALLGQGVGTVLGSAYAKKHEIKPLNLFVAPLEQCFQFFAGGEGTVFVGESDEWTNPEKIQEECRNRDLTCRTFANADHRLESSDVQQTARNMVAFVEFLSAAADDDATGVYDFTVEGRKCENIDLSIYRGKVSLVVNTATGCGFTPQYEILESFYKEYGPDDFVILDFPCNQFMMEAPGTADEIHEFCKARYQISFPQFNKVCVNGEQEIALYSYLKKKRGFHGFDMTTPDGRFLARKMQEVDPEYEKNDDIKWNFTKFMVDRNGKVRKRYEPTDSMDMIREDIGKLIKNEMV